MRALISAILLFLVSLNLGATELKGVVGAAHIGGSYTFTGQPWPVPYGDTRTRDYMTEGGNEMVALGSNVIKLWMHAGPAPWYPFTANPSYSNTIFSLAPEQRLAEIAARPKFPGDGAGFKPLFDNPLLSVYILNIMCNIPIPCAPGEGCTGENYTKLGSYEPLDDGLTAQEIAYEKNAIKNLAAYLLQHYRYSGKTFIIQTHETDWMMSKVGTIIPDNARIATVVQWLNARQDGVNEARQTWGTYGVNVYNATEFNFGFESMNPTRPTVINDVIPPKPPLHNGTYSDLYSWSCWETRSQMPEPMITDALRYFQSKAPDSAAFGAYNVYIGEFGYAEYFDCGGDTALCATSTRRFVEKSIAFGAPFISWWSLYDGPDRTGLCLVRPDSTKNPMYDVLKTMAGRSVQRYALRSSGGYYISPYDQGGTTVDVHAPSLQLWEELTLLDLNGGTLQNGDKVYVMTPNGHYLRALNAGGSGVDAVTTDPNWWEEFTIVKLNGSGEIHAGDSIALKTYLGYYFCAENGGGGVLNANRTSVGPWETFVTVNWMTP